MKVNEHLIKILPKESQQAFSFYKALRDDNINYPTPLDKKQAFSNWLALEYNFPDTVLDKIATHLSESYENALSSSNEDPINSIDVSKNLYLTLEDICFISNAVQNDKDKYSVDLFKLLTAYAAHARANPHPKQWIKCDAKDKNFIFFLASCSNIGAKEKEILTNTLHLVYNMNMRVIGSNQPTPCFRFEWQVQQSSPEDPENELVSIGPISPQTINSFISQFYLS